MPLAYTIVKYLLTFFKNIYRIKKKQYFSYKRHILVAKELTMESDCPFCLEMQDYTHNPLRQKRIIFETEHFVVFPTLGCLVVNYLLIVPKIHYTSVCYIDSGIRNEFIELVDKFRCLFQKEYGFWPIVFEHGASDNDTNKGGCCVFHAHAHIVPHRLSNSVNMVEALGLTKISKCDDFFEMAYDKPYLFFMNNDNEIYLRILTDSVVPSQVIRKCIAQDLNIKDKWNWKDYPFEDKIITTIENMKTLIK
jgi:diadenosine tetraphosphate (Ap4A) HIT family hydrolase